MTGLETEDEMLLLRLSAAACASASLQEVFAIR